MFWQKRLRTLFFVIIFLVIPFSVRAAKLGDEVEFFVDPNFDLERREKISATLQQITTRIYFYIEKDWWDSLEYRDQHAIKENLRSLGNEFYYNIYPKLTSTFGKEWTPGIDEEERLIVLIHRMVGDTGGYFRNSDEYPRVQVPTSNEKEMVYLNAKYAKSPLLKSLLSHEFLHLITFNQKERKQNVQEEIWLNEARAEYAPTFLGYNDVYEGSYLQSRVEIFLHNPSDPLIDWQNKKTDYGVASLFIHYLVDHYGIEILVDSLKSSKTGIESINYALKANGFKEDFSQIFQDWTIAVLVNDCSLGPKYCYLNENLKNLHVVSKVNFLPLEGETTFTLTEVTKGWAGHWYEIVGGGGNLKFKFKDDLDVPFKVPYLTKNKNGEYALDFLKKSEELYIENFNEEIVSLFVVPSFGNQKTLYSFSWTASIEKNNQKIELVAQLLKTIEQLKAEIARVKNQIDAILAKKEQPPVKILGKTCQRFDRNLYFGMRSKEVQCLQEFLKSQGPEIYPEGLVTGYFGPLTKKAVIRFQEKYREEILEKWCLDHNLAPTCLLQGTGFVGPSTRAKINQLLFE